MNNLRFFVDCHVFDGGLQGTTTYLKGLYQELIKDDEALFFLAASDTENLKRIFGVRDNVTYLKYRSHNKFLRLALDIPTLIKNHKIDYAHFQYVVPPIKCCKYIVTVHDVLFLDFPEYFPVLYKLKNRLLFGLSSKYSDVVLTVSDYSKKQIQKHFGIKHLAITPNAIDPAFFDPYDKATQKIAAKAKYGISDYWLFVSRWEPRKNHYTLLKVFVENGHYRDYDLVFVGEKAISDKAFDTYYTSLEDPIKARIKMLSKVNHEDLLLLVRAATLSVYPSIAEGFGIPPLESVAAGIPTSCSNTTAMSDFGFLGNNLFNPLDADDMNQKIANSLYDQNKNEKTAYLKTHYNWRVAADAFRKAIDTNIRG